MDLYTLFTTHPLTAGLHFVDERVAPYPGDFHPVGTMHHHTASRARDSRGTYRTAPSLGIVKHGRSDLPGPLCNLLISRPWEHDPRKVTGYVITDGRANDSGTGMTDVLLDVQRDIPVTRDAPARGDVSGNPWFYDFEHENDGVGELWTVAQLDFGARCAAVIHAARGWTADRAIHHRQWSSRKPDMSWRGDLPALIRPYMERYTMLLAYHPRQGVPDALAALFQSSALQKATVSCDIDEIRRQDAARQPVVAVGGPAAAWLGNELGGPWASLAARGAGTHRDGHRTVARGADADDTGKLVRRAIIAG